MKIDFYNDYFAIESFTESDEGNLLKDNYIRSMMKDKSVYKFVAFTEDEQLNSRKLTMLEQHQFWASCYDYFNDDREVLRPYNKTWVRWGTGKSQEELDAFFSTVNEMNDISCFTYEPSYFMWKEYANNGNGFCMEFELKDSDKFFPVVYLDKDKLDYTKDIIKSFTSQRLDFRIISKLAILPWVTKDLKFQIENELRFLCGDVYDQEDGPMGGRIAPGKKRLMGYKGIEYSFEYAGLVLKKVIICSKCVKKRELLEICDRIGVPLEEIKATDFYF